MSQMQDIRFIHTLMQKWYDLDSLVIIYHGKVQIVVYYFL